MSMTHARLAIPLSLLGGLRALPAAAADITFFNTGDPDGKIATASRPDSAGVFEIESADDFVLTHSTSITDATFTGLIPSGASATKVIVEIYRVFPNDSDVGRTSGPPVLDAEGADARQFAVGRRIRRSRRNQRPDLLDHCEEPQFSRGQLSDTRAAPSIPNRARPQAATVRSRARRWSST